MYHFVECPHCAEEIQLEVDVGEHIVYGGEECEHCNYVFSSSEQTDIYDAALKSCAGTIIDMAHDRFKG